jgi:hypothetical protein
VRADLQSIVDVLLASSADAGEVHLDEIGEAIGARAINSEEIDAIISALEAAGRKVVGPKGGAGEARLREVVAAARALGPELGRKPSVAEIAARSGLTADEVRHALALLKIMQR